MRRAFFCVLPALAAIALAACSDEERPATTATTVASSATGASLSLPDGTSLTVPPNAFGEDVRVALSLDGTPPAERPSFAVAVGAAVNVDLGGRTLTVPAKLELPYDPAMMPAGATDGEVFAAHFDEAANEWVTTAAIADPSRRVLVVETTHASWWQPWTWDLDAAVNSAIAAAHLDLDEVLEPFGWYDGCTREPLRVRFETRGNDNYLGFCAEKDESRAPAVRLVNRRTFVIRVSPQPSIVGSTLKESRVIFDADLYTFGLDYSQSDGSGLFTVRAEVDIPFTLATVVADLIVALPGVEQELGPSLVLGVYGCIAENPHLTRGMDALLANNVGRFKDEVGLAISDAPSVDCISDLIEATVSPDKLLFKVTKRVLRPLLTKFAAASALYQIGDGLYNLAHGPQELLIHSTYSAYFDDPFAYCAAVGTIDEPDGRWGGERIPSAIKNAFEITSNPNVTIHDIPWRCVDESVKACLSWGTHWCGRIRTEPNERVIEYCGSHANTDNAGGRALFGTDSAYFWGCRSGQPVIISNFYTVDSRGFAEEEWKTVPTTADSAPPTDSPVRSPRTFPDPFDAVADWYGRNPSRVAAGNVGCVRDRSCVAEIRRWPGVIAFAFVLGCGACDVGDLLFVGQHPDGSWEAIHYHDIGHPFAPPLPGATVVVEGAGDCLRVREAPSLAATTLTCLPDGSVLKVDGGPVFADGYIWARVETPGWVAIDFLAGCASVPAGFGDPRCP